MDRQIVFEITRRVWEKKQLLHKLRIERASIKRRSSTFRQLRSQAAATYNEMRSLEEEVRNHIEYYAAPECQALCNLIQEKLPRELRDHIYEFMIARRVHAITDSSYPTINGWAREVMGWRNEHVCKVQFVGLATLKEIAETWYRITTFEFAVGISHNLRIPTFFTPDQCEMGLDVCKLVKNVNLFLAYKLPEGDLIDNLIAGMKGLLVMTSRVRVTIIIEYHVCCLTIKLYENWVEFANRLTRIFPAIQQLLQAGHLVTMDIDDGGYVFQVRENELTLGHWLKEMKLLL